QERHRQRLRVVAVRQRQRPRLQAVGCMQALDRDVVGRVVWADDARAVADEALPGPVHDVRGMLALALGILHGCSSPALGPAPRTPRGASSTDEPAPALPSAGPPRRFTAASTGGC